MKDSFAFATGAVRAMETGLLPRAFFHRLAEADEGERRRMLVDRGFTGFESTADPDRALAGRMQGVYEDLLPYLPDPGVLDFCLLPNDFHNLKVALKGLIRGGEKRALYRRPAVFDPDGLWEILSAKAYDELPPFLAPAAREGYEILTQTGNGQAMDLELDRRCLEAVLAAAEKAGPLSRRTAEKSVLYADLRISLRLSRQNPGEALIQAALAKVPGLDDEELARCVAGGTEAVLDFIRVNFDELSEPAAAGSAALELAMDNDLAATLAGARNLGAGADVVTAYYLARETELKNVRLIMSSAGAGRGVAAVRERMRETDA